MERIEIRAIIKWYNLKGKSAAKIKAKLDEVLGEKAPAIGTIHKWISEFKKGRVGIEDECRSGRPIDVTTPQVLAEIVRIVTNDRTVNVRDLGSLVAASYGRVHNILQQQLKIKKICGEWTAIQLTAEQKCKRTEVAELCLEFQHKEPNEFEKRFLCVCSTWIRPKFAIGGVDQIHEVQISDASPANKKPKLNVKPGKKSANVLVTLCCDSVSLLGIAFHGYDEIEEIDSQHYIDFLETLSERLETKRESFKNSDSTNFYMQLDCVGLMQKSAEFLDQLRDLEIILLPNTTDSPDLFLSTCHIFPSLRKWLEGRKFFDDEAFQAAVREYFAGLGPGHYQDGLSKLESHWRKCLEYSGDYVSK